MKHVHFMGIGGSGASAIAAITQAHGFQVSGCDKSPVNEFTEGIFAPTQLLTGSSVDHLKNVDILAYTPAITALDPNNPEISEARRRGIEVLTWQEFMGKYLEEGRFVIAVCGTHGKSTTTAMVGRLLEDAKLDPTVELGAKVDSWDRNFRVGKSQYFVSEADEFNNNFLVSTPDITIVTTIEMDHPEFFKDFEDYQKSFIAFLSKTKQKIIANLSDPGVAEVISQIPGVDVVDYSQHLIDFPLEVIGEFNRLNASAAYQVGLALQINEEEIKKSLENFTGVGRRFEYIGLYKDAQVYSDFAHHPTEIEVTLKAAREKFPNNRIWVVFQPHMYSRTKALFADFVKAFQVSPIDKVSIMDIYAARETDTQGVASADLVEAIGEPKAEILPSIDDVIAKLTHTVEENDVIIFMGAGDTDKAARLLVDQENYDG